jgi:hypothetical protein
MARIAWLEVWAIMGYSADEAATCLFWRRGEAET